MLLPSLAAADEVTLVKWARERVQQGLVRPLAQQENSRFSRSRPAPHERRVRILEATLQRDKDDKGFVPFAIDIRYDSEWAPNFEGCVYRQTGALFVKIGDEYYPADFLLGKEVDEAAGVCQVAPQS